MEQPVTIWKKPPRRAISGFVYVAESVEDALSRHEALNRAPVEGVFEFRGLVYVATKKGA